MICEILSSFNGLTVVKVSKSRKQSKMSLVLPKKPNKTHSEYYPECVSFVFWDFIICFRDLLTFSFSRSLPLPREFWRHHAGQTLRMARARRRHLALPAFFGILKKRTTTNQAIIIDRYMDFSLLKANQVHGSFWDDDPVPGMAEGLKIWGSASSKAVGIIWSPWLREIN